MPYKLKTNLYKNGMYFGSPILYAPKFDSNSEIASGNAFSGTPDEIRRESGDSGFTYFKIPFHAPSGYHQASPFEENGLPGERFVFEPLYEGDDPVTYEFQIQNIDDGHARSIILIQSFSGEYTPELRLFNGFRINFYKDGVPCFSDGAMAGSCEFYNNTYGTSLFTREFGFCIPWKGRWNDEDVMYWSPICLATIETGIISTNIKARTSSIYATNSTSSSYLGAFNNWLGDWTPEDVDGDDPYPDPDDDDDSDDPQPDPLPGISAVGTGFATIFRPSLSQLRALSGLFWNETVFDFFQNLVENISDMFLSLAMVPFTVPAGATVSVTWLGIDTAISLTLAAQQFIEFNMGTIDLSSDSRIWKSSSALDYSPFSQLGIYLPFIGFRDLDIDDCRNKSMNLRYRIDLLSGECVAIITLNGATYYQFSGNCLSQIPITNEGMQALVSDAVQVGLSVAAVASAGGGAAAAEGAAQEGGVKNALDKLDHMTSTPQGRQLASTTANAVIGGKPMYGKTGSVSGAGGMLAVRQPYLYLKTPVSAIPNYYRRYCGYPCNRTATLGSFSGYTVVEDIRLNNLVATSSEVAEIYELLKGGVII